jgi:hypothetical protein
MSCALDPSSPNRALIATHTFRLLSMDTFMRKLIVTCAAAAVVIIAFAAWPWLGVYQLVQAVQSGDPEAVLERVDVDSVRRHVVHQILAPAVAQHKAVRGMGPVSRDLATIGAAAVLDARMAELFPPEEIVRLIMTGGVPEELRLATGSGKSSLSIDQYPDASLSQFTDAPLGSLHGWNYVSLTKFRIAGHYDGREPTWLTFRLQGLRWRLWQIELPSSIVEQIRPALEARLASRT